MVNLLESVVSHEVICLSLNKQSGITEKLEREDKLITEYPVVLDIEGRGELILKCTPSDLPALAVGYVFCEGLIRRMSDVITLAHTKDRIILKIKKNAKKQVEKVRKAKRQILQETSQISLGKLFTLMQDLCDHQVLFRKTGATHAAALFSAQGACLGRAEDLGRHHALDKAIGKWLIKQSAPQVFFVVLSGRVNSEMITKTVCTGCEVVLSVSAPTSAAVKIAEEHGITLCGFVRKPGLNVYTHFERIKSI